MENKSKRSNNTPHENVVEVDRSHSENARQQVDSQNN